MSVHIDVSKTAKVDDIVSSSKGGNVTHDVRVTIGKGVNKQEAHQILGVIRDALLKDRVMVDG